MLDGSWNQPSCLRVDFLEVYLGEGVKSLSDPSTYLILPLPLVFPIFFNSSQMNRLVIELVDSSGHH